MNGCPQLLAVITTFAALFASLDDGSGVLLLSAICFSQPSASSVQLVQVSVFCHF
jgi:hypothetical protein